MPAARDLLHRGGVEALLKEQAHGRTADLGLHRSAGARSQPWGVSDLRIHAPSIPYQSFGAIGQY